MNKFIKIIFVASLLNVQAAIACDCPPSTTLQEYCGSSIVVVGEIIDILQQLPSSLPCTRPGGSIRVRVVHYRPLETFKGDVTQHAFFITPMLDSQCALPVVQGRPALLFIKKNGVASLCPSSLAILPGNWRELDIIKTLRSLKEQYKSNACGLCKDVPASIDLDLQETP